LNYKNKIKLAKSGHISKPESSKSLHTSAKAMLFAPSSVLQQFALCPIESNGNKNFKVIQNPGFLPDHPQN